MDFRNDSKPTYAVKQLLVVLITFCLSQPLLAQVAVPDLQVISSSVTVNGVTLPYYDYGEGPVVVLLHGFPDSRYVWRYQLEPLAEAGFRVIAPDLRGFGEASKPTEVEAYRVPTILADLNGLLDTLNIKRAHIVGHDWGGTIGWVFAGAYPDRCLSVSGLTVGAPGAPGRRSIEQLEKFWYIFFFLSKGPAEEWMQRDDWQGLRAWTRGAGDLERYIQDLSRPGALTAGLNWYRANFSAASLNSTATPPRITVPAMGISAENDVFLLEPHVKTSEVMIDADWTYHRVNGASHWLMLDKPMEVSKLLIQFLSKI